jgi:DNA-binding FadR family transcriptional regulator
MWRVSPRFLVDCRLTLAALRKGQIAEQIPMDQALEAELDRAIDSEIQRRFEALEDFTEEDIAQAVAVGNPELMRRIVRQHMAEVVERLQRPPQKRVQ